MKTQLLIAAALIVATTILSPVQAQQCKTRCTNPNPSPSPVYSDYFLGVYTSTVPVDSNTTVPQPVAASGGNQVYVVPGYGEPVYGQRINRVVPNSPAYHAGLEPGDIILDANGYAMDSRADLIAAIQQSQGYLQIKVL